MGPLETIIVNQRATSSFERAREQTDASELKSDETLKFGLAQALTQFAVAASITGQETPIYVASAIKNAANAVADITIKGEFPIKDAKGNPLAGEDRTKAAQSYVQVAILAAQNMAKTQTLKSAAKPQGR